MEWEITDSYIYGVYKDAITTDTTKVAAFDLDFTIIKPTNGKKFYLIYNKFELNIKNRQPKYIE